MASAAALGRRCIRGEALGTRSPVVRVCTLCRGCQVSQAPRVFEVMFAGKSRRHQIGLLSPTVKEILQAQCSSPVTQSMVCAGIHNDPLDHPCRIWQVTVGHVQPM